MSGYADTSFLISLYTPDVISSEARDSLNSNVELFLTPFGEFEFANALELRVFRKEITTSQAKASFRAFEGDTGSFLQRRAAPQFRYERAMLLTRLHSRRIGVRSLDVLHVAIALELRASSFFTFDKGQARLARLAGLKIRPWR